MSLCPPHNVSMFGSRKGHYRFLLGLTANAVQKLGVSHDAFHPIYQRRLNHEAVLCASWHPAHVRPAAIKSGQLLSESTCVELSKKLPSAQTTHSKVIDGELNQKAVRCVISAMAMKCNFIVRLAPGNINLLIARIKRNIIIASITSIKPGEFT